jgi:hypothetical protein
MPRRIFGCFKIAHRPASNVFGQVRGQFNALIHRPLRGSRHGEPLICTCPIQSDFSAGHRRQRFSKCTLHFVRMPPDIRPSVAAPYAGRRTFFQLPIPVFPERWRSHHQGRRRIPRAKVGVAHIYSVRCMLFWSRLAGQRNDTSYGPRSEAVKPVICTLGQHVLIGTGH